MEGIKTKRLFLRKVSLADAEFILTLTNESGWLRFIGDKNIRSVENAETYIKESLIASYEANGFGIWLVELRGPDNAPAIPIGTCGLVNRSTLKDIDLGFAFLASYGGQGYALEAGQAAIEYARNNIRISRLLAITLPDNDRSINLLGKLGFTAKGSIDLPTADGTATESLQLFDQLLVADN